jgi:4-amino-4-deoxychorismate lyase
MNLVNGKTGGAIDPGDRGLSYGDGVFRTLRLRSGRAVLWQRQYARLAADCAALRLACPPQQAFESDLAQIAAVHADGVIRLTVTRGIAVRGYAIPGNARVTRVTAWSPAASASIVGDTGVRARWCDLRLAVQPALAGIKHLNRLENVLARAEWSDAAVFEGLLRDAPGRVIGGTMSNLFLLHAGVLTTPALEGSGVAGVTRELIVEQARSADVAVRIAHILPEEVVAADAVFLVNSIIGVVQVATLDDATWAPSAFLGTLRQWIEHAEAH